MNTLLSRALLVATLVLACSFPAAAGVIINGTRVIYPAQAREVTVQLVNTGDTPALVQAWVDSGNPDQTPETSTAPFVLTPPISRLEPGRGQSELMSVPAGLRELFSQRTEQVDANLAELQPL